MIRAGRRRKLFGQFITKVQTAVIDSDKSSGKTEYMVISISKALNYFFDHKSM